jgi:uncharacterized protein (DUF2252 family)
MGSSSAAWKMCSSVAWNSAEPTPTTASMAHAHAQRDSISTHSLAFQSPKIATKVMGTEDAVFHISAMKGEYA